MFRHVLFSSRPLALDQAHGLDELLPDLVRQLAAAEPSDPYQWGARRFVPLQPLIVAKPPRSAANNM